jgi:hypothetical protein
MKHDEFEIGKEFLCDNNRYRCTDKGTRVIVAIECKDGWMSGPTYAQQELVFDEFDQKGCYEDRSDQT